MIGHAVLNAEHAETRRAAEKGRGHGFHGFISGNPNPKIEILNKFKIKKNNPRKSEKIRVQKMTLKICVPVL